MIVQTRICSYYKSPCSHSTATATPTTFLSLPEDLRDRVYRDAGVINGDSLRIFGTNLPRGLKDGIRPYDELLPADLYSPRECHGLPFVCACAGRYDQEETYAAYCNLSISNSFVNVDVTRFLHSRNEILLCCEDYTDLYLLLHSPLNWLCSLRSLTVHLSPPARKSHEESSCCHRGCGRLAQPLRSTAEAFDILMHTWRKVANRLACSATHRASKLNLKILCDVGDVATAQRLLQVQTDYGLATASLRLKEKPHAKLIEIARSTLLRASGIQDQSFRFLDLPVELRQWILSYTDLVTPLGQVSWYEDGKVGKFRCVREYYRPYWWDVCREFCAYNFAVYPHCGCWIPPTSLFLVCKDMLADARAVFFTANRFIISIDFRRPSWMSIGPRGGQGFNFLRNLVPEEALPHLRSLEIKFPQTRYDFSEIDEDAWKFWSDLDAYRLWTKSINYLAPHLKRLSLRLYMMHGTSHSKEDQFSGDIREIEALFRVHEQIVRPLGRIKSLENCFVRAMKPYQIERWASETAFMERLRFHERHLEALAMGSEYDSIANGKLEQRQSEWTKIYDIPRDEI